MKKTLIVLLLAATLALAGCGDEEKNQNTGGTTANNNPAATTAPQTDPQGNSGESLDAYLTAFEAELAKSSLTLSGKGSKDAASIGASEGCGFNIGNYPVEIYLFDPAGGDEKTTQNLNTAKQSGYITIFGVEINGATPTAGCTVSGNLVLIFPMESMFGAHPNKTEILQAFSSLS